MRRKVCGQSSTPDPTGGAYSARLDPIAKFGRGKGLVKGRERKGRGGK